MYLAVQITTSILYVLLRQTPKYVGYKCTNCFSCQLQSKFTTCRPMTIVPLNLPWTSPHDNDVGSWITTYVLPEIINFFQPGSHWDRYPLQGGKMPITILGQCVLFLCFRSEKTPICLQIIVLSSFNPSTHASLYRGDRLRVHALCLHKWGEHLV